VPPATEHDVVAELAALREQVETCTRCGLHATRTQAVFGEGDPHALLMFVGEAPGYHEDRQGRPFVGAAGKLLEELLEAIGLTRAQVFIANVLKSRPPNNRDPLPEEIEACKPYLLTQIGLIQPRVICSLGNFATKLLSGSPAGITRVHGHPQAVEVGGHSFYLYPIFHPAAALYTPSMLATLQADFERLPDLLSAPAPDRASAAGSQAGGDGGRAQAPPQRPVALEEAAAGRQAAAEDEQLGLF
jgi:uracil-DNA glycosylase family 4